MESLYRIISFPEFINLVEKETERYRRPTAWEDTYEGFMLQMLSDDSRMNEVLNTLYKNISQDINKVIVNYLNMWAAKWLCYGQCWSKTEETDAMWRIYSFDRKSIRIETDKETIEDVIHSSEEGKNYSVYIDDVKYDLDDQADIDSQTKILRKNPRTIEPFFHKRKAFEHENEKRVILFDKEFEKDILGFRAASVSNNVSRVFHNQQASVSEILKKVKEELIKLRYPFESKQLVENIFVSKIDLSKYIKSVMVHPQADDWIVDLIKVICKKHNLNCVGKSTMYDKLI